MNRMISAVSAAALGLTLVGCASAPKDIEPVYVSTAPYKAMSCKQLVQQAEEISMRASQAYGVQKKKASNDAAATAVSLVVFWPAAFFIKGDGANAAQIAQLKGEMQAVEIASKSKGCGITFTNTNG